MKGSLYLATLAFTFAVILAPLAASGASSMPASSGIEYIKRFDFNIKTRPAGNGALGSIFTYTSEDGSLTCGAGFVSSTGTRIYHNQNDLEFWCRPAHKASELNWVPLGRPLGDFPSSMLGNMEGRLFDYLAFKYYDFEKNEWRGMDAHVWNKLHGSSIYSWRKDGNEDYYITYGLANCPGLSVFSGRGYHGTVLTGAEFNAATVWKSRLYANVDNKVMRYELARPTPYPRCNHLKGSALVKSPVYVYAMYPVADQLFIGGGYLSETDPRFLCPNIYVVGKSEIRTLSIPKCSGRMIHEIYSFSLYDDSLLVGNYPNGTLEKITLPGMKIKRSFIPRLHPMTWADSKLYYDGTTSPVRSNTAEQYHYLESQTVTVSSGSLFLGMWPWGEIYQVNQDGTQDIYRMFGFPSRSNARQPFQQEGEAVYCTGGEKNMATRTCAHRDKIKEFWGQRITSLTVLNGRLCAGTGNTRAQRYDKHIHRFITEDQQQEYGKVYCADLVNQVLAEYRPAKEGRLSFFVTPKQLQIVIDGRLAASTFHKLGPIALKSLSGLGHVLVGKGAYGPSQAVLKSIHE